MFFRVRDHYSVARDFGDDRRRGDARFLCVAFNERAVHVVEPVLIAPVDEEIRGCDRFREHGDRALHGRFVAGHDPGAVDVRGGRERDTPRAVRRDPRVAHFAFGIGELLTIKESHAVDFPPSTLRFFRFARQMHCARDNRAGQGSASRLVDADDDRGGRCHGELDEP